MVYYYTDTETTGLNPEKDRIISFTYQELNSEGYPIGELKILATFNGYSEEQIVKYIYKMMIIDNAWNFIPIMQNHLFDLRFWFEGFKRYHLPVYDSELNFLYKKPIIDIKDSLVMVNSMNFKGSGLDKLTNKEKDGEYVVLCYNNKDFNSIEKYIIQETESFLIAFQKLLKTLKNLNLK